MWLNDLDELLKELDKFEADEEKVNYFKDYLPTAGAKIIETDRETPERLVGRFSSKTDQKKKQSGSDEWTLKKKPITFKNTYTFF